MRPILAASSSAVTSWRVMSVSARAFFESKTISISMAWVSLVTILSCSLDGQKTRIINLYERIEGTRQRNDELEREIRGLRSDMEAFKDDVLRSVEKETEEMRRLVREG